MLYESKSVSKWYSAYNDTFSYRKLIIEVEDTSTTVEEDENFPR